MIRKRTPAPLAVAFQMPPRNLHPTTLIEGLKAERARGIAAVNIIVPFDWTKDFGMIAVDVDKLIQLAEDEYLFANVAKSPQPIKIKPKPQLLFKPK